uniref:Uncharacterized protein n=1 Tax=Octopus bimaculoides TaxID=37653 RepID=A0A0L8IH15_OCTBM
MNKHAFHRKLRKQYLSLLLIPAYHQKTVCNLRAKIQNYSPMEVMTCTRIYNIPAHCITRILNLGLI